MPAQAAENYLFYFGGGGEPKDKSTTIFDNSIPQLSRLAADKGYKAEYFFTHDHKDSLELAKKSIGRAPEVFNSKNWEERIKKLEADIDSGSIKSGSKILFNIDTHGTDDEGVFRMSTVDGEVTPEAALKSLARKAEEKGVQLAVVATNCTSGNLLKVASPKTCVIANSMPGQLGYAYPENMFREYLKAKNLEESFLKNRMRNASLGMPSQPSISTAAGVQTQQILAALFPYSSRKEVDSPGIGAWECEYPQDESIANLQKLLDPKVYFVHYGMSGPKESIRELTAAMKSYNKAAEKLKGTYPRLNSFMSCFDTTVPLPGYVGFGMPGPGFELMGPDISFFASGEGKARNCVTSTFQARQMISYHEQKLEEAKKVGNSGLAAEVDKAIISLNAILESPEVRKRISEKGNQTQDADDALAEMLVTREKIGQLERDIYDKIYRKLTIESPADKNPCKDFTL